jgi:hypothetical protein
MAAKNLNLLNSALAGNAKLLVTGDRIGSGLVTAFDTPTAPLSPEQFPLLPFSEPAHRSRQVVPDVMSMPHAVESVEPDGNDPGTPACRWTEREVSTELLGTLHLAARSTRASRASYPGSVMSSHRIGRDCQSPDRDFDKADQKARLLRKQQTWHRTAGTTQQAGK